MTMTKEERKLYKKAHRLAHIEEYRARARIRAKALYKAHPRKVMTPEERKESKKRRAKKYYEANPQKARDQGKIHYQTYRKKNPERVKKRMYEASRRWDAKHREERNIKAREKRARNPERTREIGRKCARKRRVTKGEEMRLAARNWYAKNREKVKAKNKVWREANPEKVNRMTREWRRIQRKNNPNFRLRCLLSHRILMAIREQCGKKCAKTIELLGCSIAMVRQHLESKWELGMSWDNHGLYGWHIDHIRPCASFDLTDPEQQRQCFHWTNLQPLWWRENIIKSDNYELTTTTDSSSLIVSGKAI